MRKQLGFPLMIWRINLAFVFCHFAVTRMFSLAVEREDCLRECKLIFVSSMKKLMALLRMFY